MAMARAEKKANLFLLACPLYFPLSSLFFLSQYWQAWPGKLWRVSRMFLILRRDSLSLSFANTHTRTDKVSIIYQKEKETCPLYLFFSLCFYTSFHKNTFFPSSSYLRTKRKGSAFLSRLWTQEIVCFRKQEPFYKYAILEAVILI